MQDAHWLDLAEAAVLQAGEQLRRMFLRRNFRVWQKSEEWGLVTEADKAADAIIHEVVTAAVPNVPVLSEESETVYPEEAHGVWIVDPIDGTTNFVAGLPYWGVLLAYVENGEPLAAAMYFPMQEEMYTALRGQGAWLNGRPIQVKNSEQWETQFVYMCSDTPWKYRVDLRHKVRILGCGAYHLALLASGRGVLSVDCAPFVWDYAAPALIVQEAGGIVTTYEGRDLFPLQPGKDYLDDYHMVLAATHPDFIEAARKHLRKRA